MNKSGLALFLTLLLVSAVFLPSLSNNFTNWDDGAYVVDNPRIRSLSPRNIKSIFSSFYMSAYQPVALLFHALEYRFFRLKPAGYHLVSLGLHVVNCALVFWLVILLGGGSTAAFLAALLFGVHPIQVEPVAWISETKGLLSAVFFLCALISFISYLNNGRLKYYYFSLFVFVLSLLSKGGAVVLPLVLLLIDHFRGRKFCKRLFLEKAPFFLAAFAMAIITVIANSSVFRLGDWAHPALLFKLAFPFYSVVFYLGKIIFPQGICCLYSYPGLNAILLSTFMFFILAWVVYLARSSRSFLFGSLFFAACLIPAVQLVEVGKAAVADRYAYLASVGVFLIAGILFERGCAAKIRYIKAAKICLCVLVFLYVASLAVLSRGRARAWKDSFALWNDALSKGEFAVAYNNRGDAYDKKGGFEQALVDYEKALRINPRFFEVYVNRGNIYYKKGDLERAIIEYKKAVELNPKAAIPRMYAASVYVKTARFPDAILELDAVIELYPAYAEAHFQRGLVDFALRDYSGAVRDFSRAIELSPDYGDAYVERANAYYILKEYGLAEDDIRTLQKAKVKVDPRVFKAFNSRGSGK